MIKLLSENKYLIEMLCFLIEHTSSTAFFIFLHRTKQAKCLDSVWGKVSECFTLIDTFITDRRTECSVVHTQNSLGSCNFKVE